MAKAEFKMPDDFLQKVSQLSEKTDKIIPLVLEAGGEVAIKKLRDNLNAVVGKDTKYSSLSTGELSEALGITPARMDKDGNFNVKVGFSEPRSNGDRNAKIANILEYGKYGQPPKPFLKLAKNQSKKPVIEVMKATLEEEIKKL